MNDIAHTWLQEGELGVLKKSLAILVALSAAGLIVAHYIYTPLQVDGAWYGYPSYALSQSRDPGENFAPLATLDSFDGLRVSFDFDTRNLRALPMTVWFKAFGTSIWAVKWYSILELSALLAAMALVLARAGASMRVTFLVFLFVLSDTVPLTLASTDLRPDLMIAALSLLVFALTVADRRPVSSTRLILAALLSCALVLTHLTSAIAFSVLGGAMLADLLLNRSIRAIPRLLAYGSVLGIGFVGLLYNQTFQEIPVPSSFDPASLYYPEVVRGFDLSRILAKEAVRWHGYFFDANVSILAVLLLTVISLPFTVFRLPSEAPATRSLIAPLVFGVICGVFVLAFVNPHRASSHAFSVVVFGLLLAGLAFDALPTKHLRRFGYAVLVVICTASVAKFALATKISLESESSGISNALIRKTVEQEFSDHNADVVLGPTNLWAYVDPSVDTLVIDKRAGRSNLSDLEDFIDRVDLIVIDREYADFDFLDRLTAAYPRLSIQQGKQLGDPESQNFLSIYSVSSD
jgi:hypothetical protein